MAMTFYHNPRCSKSRAALELLRTKDVPVRLVDYLKSPPDIGELKSLAKMLGGAHAMVRDGEPAYREAGLDASSSDEQVLEAIARHPILLQRPILVRDGKAAIGRPPEAVLALL
jgi:arsenate reductase